MAAFSLPHITIPHITFPNVTIPKVDADSVATAVQDAFYVGVGLGVLTFQRLQVRRQELTKRIMSSSDSIIKTA